MIHLCHQSLCQYREVIHMCHLPLRRSDPYVSPVTMSVRRSDPCVTCHYIRKEKWSLCVTLPRQATLESCVILTLLKYCDNRRNCSKQEIFPFAIMFPIFSCNRTFIYRDFPWFCKKYVFKVVCCRSIVCGKRGKHIECLLLICIKNRHSSSISRLLQRAYLPLNFGNSIWSDIYPFPTYKKTAADDFEHILSKNGKSL